MRDVKMGQTEIDIFFLREAYKIARDFSKDKTTQTGAIIVLDNSSPDLGKIVAKGANHFPFGVKETEERWQRPAKYLYVEHAERNAIFNAAKNGVKTDGLILYCPWFACADCGRAIIQAGIKEIVGHQKMHEFYQSNINGATNWKTSLETTFKMFDEAGVKYRFLEEKIGGVELIVASKKFQP